MWQKPYFGGLYACEAAGGGDDEPEFNPKDLVCGGCQPGSRDKVCSKHGTEYVL